MMVILLRHWDAGRQTLPQQKIPNDYQHPLFSFRPFDRDLSGERFYNLNAFLQHLSLFVCLGMKYSNARCV
jgi:hypothetical protein